MMIEDILKRIQDYAPGADIGLVVDAYQYAALCHRGQIRKSGEDYLVHPLAVAHILAELRMDVETIATGLLHDTIEDTLASYEEIEQRFGKAVAEMVDGVTKLSKLVYRGKVEEQAENFRKFVLAFGRDLRVVVVKIADRLHNMRTLEHHRPEKQKEISKETLEIYAPLVHRLGMDVVKTELEDLCFRYLYPKDHAELVKSLEEEAPERKEYVERTCEILRTTMKARGVDCEVTGRVKHLYSIFKKLQKRERQDLEGLYDLLAFRIMVPDRDQCYVVLGFVHAEFIPVKARLKDYIAVPKPNGYQSLHTTVFGPDHQMIEVQIRTAAMHRVAETGIAAHWRYKNGRLAVSNQQLEDAARLRGFIQIARDIEDPADFMDAARSDLAATIHVFTPQKDIILLPEKSTALDFAYYVHTEVGHRAQGAKVNGRLVPLKTELHPGDSVEIVTHADSKPSREWLSWAHTHRAMEKIRRRLREQLTDTETPWGQKVLDVALGKLGSSYKKVQADPAVAERLKLGGHASLEDLASAVAVGRVAPGEAARLLVTQPAPVVAPSPFGALMQRLRKPTENAIVVSGQTDILVDYARCCSPMKGEPIVGYITRGRGLSVHRSDCTMVKGLDADRFVAVTWDGSSKTQHQGVLRLTAEDRPGLLADISSLCANAHINLWRADVRAQGDRAICDLGISVNDVVHLAEITRKLKAVKGVISVERAG